MKIHPTIVFLLALATISIIAVIVRYQLSEKAAPSIAKTQLEAASVKPPSPEGTGRKPVKLHPKFSWEEITEDEIRELAAAFDAYDESRNFKQTVVVAPGQSILTDGYESTPGEFVFTAMTPRMKQYDEANTVVSITADTISIDVSGTDRTLIRGSEMIVPLRKGGASTGRIRTDEGLHILRVEADVDDEINTTLIELTMEGEFVEEEPRINKNK